MSYLKWCIILLIQERLILLLYHVSFFFLFKTLLLAIFTMFYFPPILNIFFLFKEDIPLNIPVGKSLREKVNNEMGRFKKHDYVLSF